MSGILNTTGAVSGILGKSVLPAGVTGGSGLTAVNAANIASGVLPVGVTGGSGLDASPLNGRNMIINGAFQVFQRATGATAATGVYHTADHWAQQETSDGAYTSEKHAMSLADINTTGHSNAIELNVTTADGTIGAGQLGLIKQKVEAQNCQHLQWGTAAAKDVTLSFWVKSKIAGSYFVMLQKSDSTAYYINREYTINDADTWEHKTITTTPTAGSTTLITGAGGIIANDNGIGINVSFVLFAGSNFHATTNTWATAEDYATSDQVNWMSSTSNDFYLTGVQFEAGSVATPFEHQTYDEVENRCLRYYNVIGGTSRMAASAFGSTGTTFSYSTNVRLRAQPSLVHLGTTAHRTYRGATQSFDASTTDMTIGDIKGDFVNINAPGYDALTDNRGYTVHFTGDYQVGLEAEI